MHEQEYNIYIKERDHGDGFPGEQTTEIFNGRGPASPSPY